MNPLGVRAHAPGCHDSDDEREPLLSQQGRLQTTCSSSLLSDTPGGEPLTGTVSCCQYLARLFCCCCHENGKDEDACDQDLNRTAVVEEQSTGEGPAFVQSAPVTDTSAPLSRAGQPVDVQTTSSSSTGTWVPIRMRPPSEKDVAVREHMTRCYCDRAEGRVIAPLVLCPYGCFSGLSLEEIALLPRDFVDRPPLTEEAERMTNAGWRPPEKRDFPWWHIGDWFFDLHSYDESVLIRWTTQGPQKYETES